MLPEKGQAVGDNGLKILVFGATPPCATCRQAEQEAYRAAQRYPAGRVRVEHHDAHSEVAQAYGVALTPTIVVGDRKFSGKVLPAEEMIPIIESFLHL